MEDLGRLWCPFTGYLEAELVFRCHRTNGRCNSKWFLQVREHRTNCIRLSNFRISTLCALVNFDHYFFVSPIIMTHKNSCYYQFLFCKYFCISFLFSLLLYPSAMKCIPLLHRYCQVFLSFLTIRSNLCCVKFFSCNFIRTLCYKRNFICLDKYY